MWDCSFTRFLPKRPFFLVTSFCETSYSSSAFSHLLHVDLTTYKRYGKPTWPFKRRKEFTEWNCYFTQLSYIQHQMTAYLLVSVKLLNFVTRKKCTHVRYFKTESFNTLYLRWNSRTFGIVKWADYVCVFEACQKKTF